ncbi:MAG: hypothetical protein NVSMB25_07780 [Thermoleophilaceae bacterium]
MRPIGQIIVTGDDLGPFVAAWDQLAVDAGRPYCAPGWLLSWWSHARPPGAVLRVVVVQADGVLIGVAPMYAQVDRLRVARYSFLAGDIAARVEPLAKLGREREVAGAVVTALARARPALGSIGFEGVPTDSAWPGLLAGGWPHGRRAWLHRKQMIVAPAVTVNPEGFDAWMKSKSSNFRQQMRRSRRKLEGAGAVFRRAERLTLERDLRSFSQLHKARWAERGGSSALLPGVEEMLSAAADALIDSGRFRLTSIDIDGRTISSQLYLVAGAEMSYWLGGFDKEWAAQHPTLVALVAGIEEAHTLGHRRLDLGPGAMDYKYRMADTDEPLAWIDLVPRGPRYPLVRLRLLPQLLRPALAARLSDRQKRALLRMLRPFWAP